MRRGRKRAARVVQPEGAPERLDCLTDFVMAAELLADVERKLIALKLLNERAECLHCGRPVTEFVTAPDVGAAGRSTPGATGTLRSAGEVVSAFFAHETDCQTERP